MPAFGSIACEQGYAWQPLGDGGPLRDEQIRRKRKKWHEEGKRQLGDTFWIDAGERMASRFDVFPY
jgi:hypothetical protein